jgi:hypothetical protein
MVPKDQKTLNPIFVKKVSTVFWLKGITSFIRFYILCFFTLQTKTPLDFCELIVRWIICENYPFTAVESVFFQNIMSARFPNTLIPSADTIKLEVMASFKKEKNKIKNMLQASIHLFPFSSVLICSDINLFKLIRISLGKYLSLLIHGHHQTKILFLGSWHQCIGPSLPLRTRHLSQSPCNTWTNP